MCLVMTAVSLAAGGFAYLRGLGFGSKKMNENDHMPTLTGRFSGDRHVARADRVCLHFGRVRL